MKIGIVAGVIVLIIALVVCLVPLKEVAYTATVDYQDTETYYEDEPYEDTETYYETEPLTYKVVKSYTDTEFSHKERRQIVIGGVVFQDEVVEVFYLTGYVTVQNIDSVYGAVGVQFTFYALDKWFYENTDNFVWEEYKELLKPPYGEYGKPVGEVYQNYVSLDLQSGEVGTAKYSVRDINLDTDEWYWEYEVAGSKTVEKQRTVTKYRQVEKERTVTKQRPETRYKKVTLLDYLLRY